MTQVQRRSPRPEDRRASAGRIGSAVLGIMVLLAGGSAAAQPLFPGTITPDPGNPFEPVTATLAVPGCAASGPRHTGTELTRTDQLLKLTVEAPSSFPCFSAGDPRTEVPVDILLGPLEVGTYTLEHFRQIDDGTPELLETLTFEITGELCGRAAGPGATLLVPYFEVDLGDSAGRTTAVSINNADDEPVVTRVTMWTDWGIPVLHFDVYLKANDVQAFNLRQIIEGGVLPVTGEDLDPQTFPGCSAPLALPTLDAAARARLQAQLAGDPAPDGRCYGRDRGDGRAVGFLTVDALNDCSETLHFVWEDGYFEPGGTGLASNRNVLWGDVFHIDPGSNSAQGLQALALQAFPRPVAAPTFYGLPGSDRNTLAVTYRSRYLNGGDFEGGGRLHLFTPARNSPEGLECGSTPTFANLEVASIDEAGGPLSEPRTLEIFAVTQSLDLSDPALGLTSPFGALDLTFAHPAIILPLPPVDPRKQGFVAPMLTAGDRYSVGLDAIATSTLCEPSTP